MPEILIASCPPVGHVAPLLNVARGLVARGDRVTFLTSARHADRIRAVGAEPRPLPLGADYDDSTFDADLPGRAETSGIARINFDVETHLRPPAALPVQCATGTAGRQPLRRRHHRRVLPRACCRCCSDDSASRPPILAYTTTPLFLSSRDTAPGGPGITPMPGAVGRLRNRVLKVVDPAHAAAAGAPGGRPDARGDGPAQATGRSCWSPGCWPIG